MSDTTVETAPILLDPACVECRRWVEFSLEATRHSETTWRAMFTRFHGHGVAAHGWPRVPFRGERLELLRCRTPEEHEWRRAMIRKAGLGPAFDEKFDADVDDAPEGEDRELRDALDGIDDERVRYHKARNVIVVAVLALGVLGWIVASAMEASAYERVTGKSVSTWDAMFLDLRVQEGAK